MALSIPNLAEGGAVVKGVGKAAVEMTLGKTKLELRKRCIKEPEPLVSEETIKKKKRKKKMFLKTICLSQERQKVNNRRNKKVN